MTTTTDNSRSKAGRDLNVAALTAFRSAARRMAPTKAHRPALWENMLGTVYARNPAGAVEYFDYDYVAAVAFIGEVEDVRVTRLADRRWAGGDYQAPRLGQVVWFAKDKGAQR